MSIELRAFQKEDWYGWAGCESDEREGLPPHIACVDAAETTTGYEATVLVDATGVAVYLWPATAGGEAVADPSDLFSWELPHLRLALGLATALDPDDMAPKQLVELGFTWVQHYGHEP